MITFCTHSSHVKTARVLDSARLNKQRAETLQILAVLRGETDGNFTHLPQVKMWDGHEEALVWYGLVMCHEWRIERGLNGDDTWGKLALMAAEYGLITVKGVRPEFDEVEHPPWLADKDLLRSHRSRLIEKAPHIYEDVFPGTPENMPYLWPQLVPRKSDPRGYRLRLSKEDEYRLEKGERELPEWLEWDPHKLEVVHV